MREEEDRPWRRDVSGHPVCLCGHLLSGHRVDTKAEPCARPACGCRTFRLGWTLYRETRWIRVYVPPREEPR